MERKTTQNVQKKRTQKVCQKKTDSLNKRGKTFSPKETKKTIQKWKKTRFETKKDPKNRTEKTYTKSLTEKNSVLEQT